jgi:hypothetical protein
LADGVLDRKGDLNAIKLRTGSQAFFEKLAQLGIQPAANNPNPGISNSKSPLPVDRPLGFANAARQRINGALLRCEERYPQAGAHSVLYVVVDRDAAQWQGRLAELHEEYFRDTDPLAPVRLEVIDRATDEAVQRLIDAGLVTRTMRAARPLLPPDDAAGSAAPPLSNAEREKAAAHRAHAARKLKMARVLGDTGFTEETRPALLDATHTVARAMAVEHRFPEPAALDDVFLAPLSHLWSESLAMLRRFAGDASADWKPVADVLGKRLA